MYDDFIGEFTASKFNASAWVELFENAGAKYFVLTTVRNTRIHSFPCSWCCHCRNTTTVWRCSTRARPRTAACTTSVPSATS